MKKKAIIATVSAFTIVVLLSTAQAQNAGSDIYWHIDPSVKSCSMVIDPALTQAQWKTFVQQVGAVSTFKSLAPAEPLGTLHFNIRIDYSSSPIDQRNPAWINTFTHPDEDCPLGDAVIIPTLRAALGVSENMDIGAFWTAAPDANYGMVGGEVKYRLAQESESLPAVAVRGSVTILTGVPDYDLSIYGIDLLASKRFAMFTPYLGLRGGLAIGTETTSKVRLDREHLALVQGYAGVSCSVSMFTLAAEYDIASVNTFAFAIGLKL